MIRSLRAQLSLSILVVVLFTVALISILANIFVNRQFEAYITEQETARSENIAADLGVQYDEQARGWDAQYLHAVGMYALYDGYILKIYNELGEMAWDAENHDMALCSQIMVDISARMEKSNPYGGFSAHQYELAKNGRPAGSVSIHYYGPYFYTEDDFYFLSTLNVVLLAIGVIASVLALCFGWLLARRIARPIAKTAGIAQQIAQGNYEIRFEGHTKTKELNELVASVNQLAGALGEQERLRERLTTDVAHELRTPLTAISSHLEMMAEGLWEASPQRLQSCLDEIARLGKLVSDLEQLAKAEGDNLKLDKGRIDLLELARFAGDLMKGPLDSKGISFSAEGGPSVVNADKDRIMQVFANLLSNAIKYTQENGNIRIVVEDTPAGGSVTIEDDGIGIPGREQHLIFERFYRTDQSRNRKTGGAGIGLAIVKSILLAHSGAIRVENGSPRGSRFIFTLPK
ncbi:MAG: HAMP domain-containing protein [Clostridiales Family XIII bacterium]|nr:HAMP domain-containing protein [Clostridiales Family XIII bacterium]